MRSANFDLLEKIKDAFKSHGQTFSAHDCDIRPITGDLKFRHKPTGIYSFVEMEVSHCSYDEDTNTINHRRHRMFGGVDTPRPIFHGWNDWDYILTALSGVEHAFLLPRDALPLHWFEVVSDWSEASNNLELKFPNRKAMEYYKVSLADPKQLAETVEKILLTAHYPDPTKFTFKAHGILPPRCRQGDVIVDADEDVNEDLDELDLNEFDDIDLGMEGESATEEESDGKQVGFPTKYESDTLQRVELDGFGLLMHMCCERSVPALGECVRPRFSLTSLSPAFSKRGLVLQLSCHAYGRFIFINWRWTNEQCDRYKSHGELPIVERKSSGAFFFKCAADELLVSNFSNISTARILTTNSFHALKFWYVYV